MSIIRIEKNGDYTVLANAPLNDERLSWEARGMLAYLLSKPNDWTVNSRALVKRAPAGRAKVQRILRELEKYGYLERRKVRGEHGRFVWESIVREAPIPLVQDGIGDHLEEFPETPQPQTETEAEAAMAQKLSHGESDGSSTMAQFSADGKTADGKPSQLINTVLTNTEPPNTDQPITTAAINRARVKPPGKKSAVAAVAKLPPEIHEALRELGWVGNKSEVLAAWKQDPDRLRAWIDYVRAKGGGGGLLRKLLREEPGYPPDEPSQPALFGGWAEYTAETADAFPGETAPPVPHIQGNSTGPEVNHPDMGDEPLGIGFDASPNNSKKTPSESNGNGSTPDLILVEPHQPLPENILALAGERIGVLNMLPPTPDMHRWWALAVGQIRGTMSKADFATWLQPARLVAYRDDDDHSVLVVVTANEYARQWLTERLKTTLERQLLGFAGRPVSVEFVVG